MRGCRSHGGIGGLPDSLAMKFVITGVSGLIGSALATSLRSDGHEVVGLSRSEGSGLVRWDVEAGQLDPSALAGADAVVHLAGESIGGRWTTAKKRRLVDSRVRSTELLVSTMAALDDAERPAVFVGGSAMGVYGDRGDEVLTEASSPGSSFLADLVVRWEGAARPLEDLGVRVCHARTSLVLGADAESFRRLVLVTKLGASGPLGGGRQYWSWISLSDQVRALRHLLDEELTGPVNITAPHPVSQRAFARSLAKALRRPAWVPAPGFAIRLLLGEMGQALLLDSTRLEPRALLDSGFEFEHETVEAAIDAALGRQP